MNRLNFYCQKVLPLVYDDSISYYEVLCKVKAKLNEVIASQNDLSANVSDFEKEQNARFTEFANQLKQDIALWEIGQGNKYNEFTTSVQKQFDDFFEHYMQTLGVVQVTGDSEIDVMSQKSVTQGLNNKVNVQSVESEISGAAGKIPNSAAIYSYAFLTRGTYNGELIDATYGEWTIGEIPGKPALTGGTLLRFQGTIGALEIDGIILKDGAIYYFINNQVRKLLDEYVIVQSTGSDPYSVMSQQAVTDWVNSRIVDNLDNSNRQNAPSQHAVNAKFKEIVVDSVDGNATDKAPSQRAVKEALAGGVSGEYVVDSLDGESTTKAPSQRAVSEGLEKKADISSVENKVDKSQIVQVTGTSETDVMSQNSVTVQLDNKVTHKELNDVTLDIQMYVNSKVNAVLPQVSAADNGAFLRVVSGRWTKASVPNAEGVSF